MTPAELNIYANAYVEMRRGEQKQAQRNSYAMATMVRAAVGAKRMPAFDKFFPEKTKKQMSDKQMFDMVQSLNKSFGGKEVK